jgi:hypothetical protein
MKTKRSLFGFKLGTTALLVALGMAMTALPARATLLFAGVNMGQTLSATNQWALFALSGGITVSDLTAQTPNAVTGNIGVAGGGITLTGQAKVNGNAYIKTGGTLVKSGTANVLGTTFLGTQDALMNQVKADAIAASAQANALADYDDFPNLIYDAIGMWNSTGTVNQNTDLSLSDGTGGGGHFVLHLTDFVLSGGATFTLIGTAATTYVINVSGKFQLIGGKIALSGGLLPENVLFNVVGSGTNVTMNSAAQFQGVLLANNRNVNISGGATTSGTIIAAKVSISGGSKIAKPTYTSP